MERDPPEQNRTAAKARSYFASGYPVALASACVLGSIGQKGIRFAGSPPLWKDTFPNNIGTAAEAGSYFASEVRYDWIEEE